MAKLNLGGIDSHTLTLTGRLLVLLGLLLMNIFLNPNVISLVLHGRDLNMVNRRPRRRFLTFTTGNLVNGRHLHRTFTMVNMHLMVGR